jgi:serine/threonine-protein kinase
MVEDYVPAGDFQMGMTDTQIDQVCGTDSSCVSWYANSKPQHTVTLDAYWIDQTEVTNGKYAKCVAAGKCTAPHSISSSTQSDYYTNPSFAEYPVINVDWNQAAVYCTWVGGHLPTEAQWEKAARGTDGRLFPWGAQMPDGSLANFNGHDTTKVGSYPAGASPYGALDMAGNVWKWVADWYNGYSGTVASNPAGPTSGTKRVWRGGSWSNGSRLVGSASRDWVNSDVWGVYSGFRCAR